MTQPLKCELRPDDELARTKLSFLSAAHAASPLRAVERYPFTAVSATATATMAATIIASGTLFGKVGGGLFNHGLSVLAAIVRSKLAQSGFQPPMPAAGKPTAPGETVAF